VTPLLVAFSLAVILVGLMVRRITPAVARPGNGRPIWLVLLLAVITVFGLWGLPHFTINGHHYRFWIL
jgi:hypothetical protein